MHFGKSWVTQCAGPLLLLLQLLLPTVATLSPLGDCSPCDLELLFGRAQPVRELYALIPGTCSLAFRSLQPPPQLRQLHLQPLNLLLNSKAGDNTSNVTRCFCEQLVLLSLIKLASDEQFESCWQTGRNV